MHSLNWRVGSLAVAMGFSTPYSVLGMCLNAACATVLTPSPFLAGGPGHQHPAAVCPHPSGCHAPVGLSGTAQHGTLAHERAPAGSQVTQRMENSPGEAAPQGPEATETPPTPGARGQGEGCAPSWAVRREEAAGVSANFVT